MGQESYVSFRRLAMLTTRAWMGVAHIDLDILLDY